MAVDEPIIIIKKTVNAGDGYHGGAWKVAYADFVTAMMAFFLLLWLLNTTSPEQKMGLADYFTPTIGIKDSMGIGSHGGLSPNMEGKSMNRMSDVGFIVGQVRQGPVSQAPTDAVNADMDAESSSAGNLKTVNDEESDEEGESDSELFQLAEQEIRQAMNNDPNIREYKNNVKVEQTDEGMKINLIDDPKKEMFIAGGARLTEAGKKVLDSMANIVVKTPNKVVIVGHTDGGGPSTNDQYTSWELSADRANAARRALVSTRVEDSRITKVIGMADKELLEPDDPSNPRNRRITIILLRGTYFRDPTQRQLNRNILSVPDAVVKEAEAVVMPKIEAEPADQEEKPSMFDPENAL